MQVATIDAMAGGGRMIAGLGVSGPQIVEGWYGARWGNPKEKMRDYVTIMKKTFRREGPVSHDGLEIQLPYRGEDASGMGKPLKSILHMNPDIPVWLGTGAKETVILTAEVGDGWLPFGLRHNNWDTFKPWIEEGFRRAGNGKSWKDFEIQGGLSLTITEKAPNSFAAPPPMIRS